MKPSELDGDALRDLAKRALAESFNLGSLDISDDEKARLNSSFGAFVTLKVNGNLRGCIGRLDISDPLWVRIPELARSSAFEDNRFNPLVKEELDSTEIEITILGEPEEVENLDDVTIGRDGLIIEKGLNRGLLLPQVAVEYKWDLDEFLANTCAKAGLPPDEWKKEGVKIYRFEGVVL